MTMKGMTRQLIIYKISIAGEVILFLITRKPVTRDAYNRTAFIINRGSNPFRSTGWLNAVND